MSTIIHWQRPSDFSARLGSVLGACRGVGHGALRAGATGNCRCIRRRFSDPGNGFAFVKTSTRAWYDLNALLIPRAPGTRGVVTI